MGVGTSKADFYHVLQVSPRADAEVIKAAYHALMKKHFPNGSETAGRTAVMFNNAYEVLSNPRKREQYDHERNGGNPTMIGDYRLLSKIAEGGFGKTYLGEHVINGGKVCIKHCSEISPEMEEILVQESSNMWDLRHFGIPAAHGLVRMPDESLALVMSYIPGLTLAERLEKFGALDPEHVAWITERLLNILKYLHYHGVVHGDVKPQNIIVQGDSHSVFLVDFGLSELKPKSTTRAKGYTQYFASPEQEQGLTIVPESDFYSLALTMIYAMSADFKHLLKREVPAKVPDAFGDFFMRMLPREVRSRPSWPKEDLCETIHEVRLKAFGRANSNMKPLPD